MTEPDRRRLWVRAGGRCSLCKIYLLEGDLTAEEVLLGEGAHIVGQTKSEKSPRGLDPLPVADRDLVDNIMLACPGCHNEIDKQKVAGLLDVEFLMERKREHESDIRIQTGLVRDRRTAVVRMAGAIRGGLMELPRAAATEAVVRSAQRFPFFLESYDRQGVEVDLHPVDGEHPLQDGYYAAAVAKIDAAFANRIGPGIVAGDIEHLSVFAIARLPLLVYLGSRLDDGIPTDVYQRHRATDSWIWPQTPSDTTFAVTPSREGLPDERRAVLITNLSGNTPLTDLPDEVTGSPVWTLEPRGAAAEDVLASVEVLGRFEQTVRAFFTDLERTHKHVTELHIFGALPLAAAVVLGRSLKATGLRPVVITYDRTDSGYRRALEI